MKRGVELGLMFFGSKRDNFFRVLLALASTQLQQDNAIATTLTLILFFLSLFETSKIEISLQYI